MSKRYLLIIWLSLIVVFPAASQVEEVYEEEEFVVTADITGDTNIYIHPIVIATDSLNKWKQDPNLNYSKKLDSLLRLQQKEMMQNLMDESENSPSFLDRLFSAAPIKILLWGLALFFVGFLVYQLLLTKGFFVRSVKSAGASQIFAEEKMSDGDAYPALLQQAEQAGDYRMAIRIHYLMCIFKMDQKGLIHLEEDKTNSAYVKEMPEHKRNDFSQLSMYYEYAWYGRMSLTREQYQDIAGAFTLFQKK